MFIFILPSNFFNEKPFRSTNAELPQDGALHKSTRDKLLD